jgi:DNA-binding MarR family transcriptional regulator
MVSGVDKLSQVRLRGIGRLLARARQDFVDRVLAGLQESGRNWSVSASTLLPFIDLGGTRSIDIARRAGISKQAVVKSIQQMEDAGLVTRTADATDGRASLVKFTKKGMKDLLKIHQIIDEIEKEYEAIVGVEGMKALRQALSLIAYPDERSGVKSKPAKR